MLAADGYLLGAPANIGYMSGALKHFFDGIYYPCLAATRRRPYGRSVESIATGLQWRKVDQPDGEDVTTRDTVLAMRDRR